MATKVYLPEADGSRLDVLKTQLLNLVTSDEGITNEEILQTATNAGMNPEVNQELVDALLGELQREGKVKLYV